jgi:Zn ribbon nucleic-acid-binding protein
MLPSVTIESEARMSPPTCILCAFYHPQAEPHLPEMTGPGRQTCAAGLRRLEHELLSIRSAFRRLEDEVRAEPGARDAISMRLPSAPVPAPSSQPHVSGSKERQLPIDVNRADLLLPVVPGYVQDPYGDQHGYIPVATRLNEWAAEWHDRWYPYENYPATDAISLINWMLGVRLLQAANHEEAIVEFAQEMRDLRGALRSVLGESKPAPVIMWGVSCPRCKLISQLALDPEDPDHYRECANCGLLLTRAEYLSHLRDLVDTHRTRPEVAGG